MNILYPLTRRISRNSFKIRLIMLLTFIEQDEIYISLREQYGIPLTTITRYIYYISNFLVSMSREFIKLPSPAEYESISRWFRQISPISGSLLAIDATNIPISAPRTNRVHYYNRKQFVLIVLYTLLIALKN